MRNSVKVVIDAFDGTVTAYLADPRDPLVLTLAKVFPGIFQPLDAMSADLRAHLRYPEDLFRVQTDLYATYHMAEPEIFYHREDQWQKPVLSRPGERPDPFLRHIVMRLPEERQAEFILMVPFTPRGKDNLASWMVARNDGEHYGRLVLYRFPKQSLVYGPTQIVNRINQDTDISRQISLWDQRGSEVIRGNLLVIPIEESLIYVQPLYLRAEGGRIPEMKRVVVPTRTRWSWRRRSRPGWHGCSAARSSPSRLPPRRPALPVPATAAPRVSPARQPSCTSAPSRRSAAATGPATAKRCPSWARCCASCRPSSEAASPSRQSAARPLLSGVGSMKTLRLQRAPTIAPSSIRTPA